jgi:hypothetical protein
VQLEKDALLQLLPLLETETDGAEKSVNPYEGKPMVDVYLGFHYGPSYFGIENFPKVCA